ncbi:colipase isoform X2 [Trichosurus vulpecula]|uniref:colipase isoform X2 n=1 Tax=Trichosurus vulpecula TaxID=9337 RepID=UPI00186AC40D|nr:colipase isoform X2 [Trichosurus vulpecula]
MEKVVILVLISLAVAYAAPDPRGLVINLSLYGVYYKCPCELGLTCEGDTSIWGSITNTNFGICNDVGRSKE